MEPQLRVEDFFDLTKTNHRALFDGPDVVFVWDVLKRIKDYVKANLNPGIHGRVMETAVVEKDVYIGDGTVVEPGAYIKGPSIIGKNCEIRQGAYIRGDVVVDDGAVIGHTTELKMCYIGQKAEVPHFSYVGDSIFGFKGHLGAGVKISNLKLTRDEVVLTIDGKKFETGLRKFGCILGDESEIGCNAVCNPGTVIGKRCIVYTNTAVFGYIPSNTIRKLRQSIEDVHRK